MPVTKLARLNERLSVSSPPDNKPRSGARSISDSPPKRKSGRMVLRSMRVIRAGKVLIASSTAIDGSTISRTPEPIARCQSSRYGVPVLPAARGL
jgi:hypothetical protein